MEMRRALFLVRENILLTGICDPLYDPAGDLCAGIAGGLGRKVIGVVVDDDRSALHLIYGKTVSQE